MSYDLHCFRVQPGQDSLRVAKASYGTDSDDPNPGPRNAEADRRKAALAAGLRKANPALERFEIDYVELARLQNVREAEARCRWRHVELNAPDDGSGVQITLHDETASVALPYWHHGDTAARVWREVWRYLQICEEQGDYRTYDPQLERVLSLANDLPAVLAAYGAGVAQTDRIAAGHRAEQARPWWRFW